MNNVSSLLGGPLVKLYSRAGRKFSFLPRVQEWGCGNDLVAAELMIPLQRKEREERVFLDYGEVKTVGYESVHYEFI